jgi:hypothetical protein
MRTYRIDNRIIKIGDELLPQGKYQGELDKKKIRVEEILERNRPKDKPQRGSVLMLFRNFQNAKKHWTIQKDSKFYNVELLEAEILHIGDYTKVEQLYKCVEDEEQANRIAREYWAGEMSENGIPEIFVGKATVSEIVSDDEKERKNAFSIRAGNVGMKGIRIINEEE